MNDLLLDLDEIIEKHDMNCRIEASPPFRFFVKSLGANPKRYVRQGLGVWEAFPVEVRPLGEFVIAAPEHDLEVGSSLWFTPSANLTACSLAAAICVICRDRRILFATTDGDFIQPDFDLIKSFRQAADRNNEPQKEAAVAEGAILVKPGKKRMGVLSRAVALSKNSFKSKSTLIVGAAPIENSKTSKTARGSLSVYEAGPKTGELEWTFPQLERKSYKRV